MFHGYVVTPAAHCVSESGGGQEAQQACMIHAAVHYKHDKKWLLHADLATVTSFVIAVKKQFQPLRDHLIPARPYSCSVCQATAPLSM